MMYFKTILPILPVENLWGGGELNGSIISRLSDGCDLRMNCL